MTLSDNEIAGAVRDAGFPKHSWTVAVAIALAESSGNPTATNHNTNGSTDYGLFQINSVHSDLLSKHNWQDPTDNARMALAISSHGNNWLPWTTFSNGRYRMYLPRAKSATGEPATPSGGGTDGTSPGVVTAGFPGSGIASGTGAFFGMLTNPDTWKRLAFIIAGGFLVLYALSRLTDVDNQILSGVAKAGEVAALA